MSVDDESVEPPPKLLSLSQTRWLAIADCIERILAQYQALQEFFEKAEQRSYNVRILREMYRDRKNHAYLVFLASVLRSVRRVNKMFQTNAPDPLVVFQELENLYLEVLRRILHPSVLRHNTTESLLSLDLVKMRSIFLQPETADLGDVFREKLSLVSTEDQGAVRDRCFQFLRQMAIQLQQRLPNASSTLRRLHAINPDNIESAKSREGILKLPLHFF